jgi:hypothetical protein
MLYIFSHNNLDLRESLLGLRLNNSYFRRLIIKVFISSLKNFSPHFLHGMRILIWYIITDIYWISIFHQDISYMYISTRNVILHCPGAGYPVKFLLFHTPIVPAVLHVKVVQQLPRWNHIFSLHKEMELFLLCVLLNIAVTWQSFWISQEIRARIFTNAAL